MDRTECPTCRRQFDIVPHFMRGICPHCGRMLSELIPVGREATPGRLK